MTKDLFGGILNFSKGMDFEVWGVVIHVIHSV